MAKPTSPAQSTQGSSNQFVADLVELVYHKRCIYSLLLKLLVHGTVVLKDVALALADYKDVTQLVSEEPGKPTDTLINNFNRIRRKYVLRKVLRYLQHELGVKSLSPDQLALLLEEQVKGLASWKILSHFIILKLITDETVDVEDLLPTPTAILGLPAGIQEELYEARVHLQCRSTLLEAALTELAKELGTDPFTPEQFAMLRLTALANPQAHTTVH